ncbi:type II toxin-antitoxin system Phd/YefM family antitoxin [Marinicella rhabdoformis]|uniref:type II toxin-antitoxin system Phd/YefM family antitoxin n=1 Tax=Marinicella rhabdoformis TaxID=2580566 RepID=UPI0012AED24B|nr:type II toxin-antitoxin system Phd/YefM family antitoxin [Marinicella rhabdoformis]
MENISANLAKTRFGELLMKAQKSPVQIDKNGRPVAVLMSIEDYQASEQMKTKWFESRMQEAKTEIKKGQLVDGEQVLNQLMDDLVDQ